MMPNPLLLIFPHKFSFFSTTYFATIRYYQESGLSSWKRNDKISISIFVIQSFKQSLYQNQTSFICDNLYFYPSFFPIKSFASISPKMWFLRTKRQGVIPGINGKASREGHRQERARSITVKFNDQNRSKDPDTFDQA